MISGCSRRGAAFALAQLLALVAGCASSGRMSDDAAGSARSADPVPWLPRLQGDAIVLLGEVHDNARQHALRLAILRQAFAAGWRPAIAMEQFHRQRQPDIERARRERRHDADHVIALAVPPDSGWNWDDYRPVVALALQYQVPLLAADLAPADAAAIVRGGYASVFDEAQIDALGLDRSIDAAWLAAQEGEIDAGHCHMLPPALLPKMAQAQFARDAAMADVLRHHSAHGVVLLAGNGHVRRDLGVARWLAPAERARVFAVGFLEEGGPAWPADAFDAVVVTPAAERPDPCARFNRRGAG